VIVAVYVMVARYLFVALSLEHDSPCFDVARSFGTMLSMSQSRRRFKLHRRRAWQFKTVELTDTTRDRRGG